MNGIVGLWHMDEVAGTSGAGSVKDKSGNANNGTTYGGTVFGLTGKLGNAASFDGSSGYIQISNSSSLNGWSNQTISVWVKANPGMTSCARLIEKGANSEWSIVWNRYSIDNKIWVQ
jgi:hypothetical protein